MNAISYSWEYEGNSYTLKIMPDEVERTTCAYINGYYEAVIRNGYILKFSGAPAHEFFICKERFGENKWGLYLYCAGTGMQFSSFNWKSKGFKESLKKMAEARTFRDITDEYLDKLEKRNEMIVSKTIEKQLDDLYGDGEIKKEIFVDEPKKERKSHIVKFEYRPTPNPDVVYEASVSTGSTIEVHTRYRVNGGGYSIVLKGHKVVLSSIPDAKLAIVERKIDTADGEKKSIYQLFELTTGSLFNSNLGNAKGDMVQHLRDELNTYHNGYERVWNDAFLEAVASPKRYHEILEMAVKQFGKISG